MAGAPRLFDPAAAKLESLRNAAFEKLSGRDRLIARGLEPDLYLPPPEVRGAIEQADNIRRRLHPGFRYARRLRRRARAALELFGKTPPARWGRWLDQMEERTPEQFLMDHRNLMQTRGPQLPTHAVQALRHSERQFLLWFLDELARRIDDLGAGARAPPIDALLDDLRHPDAARRWRAVRVLGGLESDPLATAALDRALVRERSTRVMAELVAARMRHGGRNVEPLVEGWLEDHRPAVRVAGYRACRTLEGRWVDALLTERLEVEQGRPRDDLTAAVAFRANEERGAEGRVSFYGIATHSRRVLFCIDVSGSMRFPMDGKGGTREPRIEKTKRELLKTIGELDSGLLFNVVLFASGTVPWKPRLVRATEANRENALRFLERAPILPSTNIHGVLDFALKSGAETTYLLTDGEPNNGSIIDPALIIEEIAHRNRHGGTILHTIGLSRDQNAELLANLAHRNAGKYVASR